MTFYMSCGGMGRAKPWSSEVANIWRIGNDHLDCWTDGPCPRAVGYHSNGHGTKQAIGYFRGASKFAGPGGWNTGDFLKTGGESCDLAAKPGDLCPKQTLEEYRTEFTMWSMASSPLLVSTDVRNLTQIQRQILLNVEVIAIDQQPVAGDEVPAAAEAAPPPLGPWFSAAGYQACSYPRCCPQPVGECRHSAFPLVTLGDAKSQPPVRTAADCQQLCEAHAECEVWQVGSPGKGRECSWVQNMSRWAPVGHQGERAAGCKVSAVHGCGTAPTPPPPPPPRPPAGKSDLQVWAKPLEQTAYPHTTGWSGLAEHRAIALLNLGEAAGDISSHLSAAAGGAHGGSGPATWSVRDVWGNATRTVTVAAGELGLLNATVGAHEVRLYRVWKH